MIANSAAQSRPDRRRFLGGIGAVAGLAAFSQVPLEGSALAAPRVRGGEYPFKLGIASGDPTPYGVVLWTRLVPELFSPDGGMPSRPVPVDWQIEEDLDLVIHLGDYVYEYGIPADGGARQTPTPDVLREGPTDLDRWRMQYALYKSDPDLQRVHARFPWLVTWDDHEVQNDYVGDYDGTISPSRVAAYKAWYEHQPVGRRSLPRRDGSLLLYRRRDWGRLAQLDVLDTRQYRTAPPCGWGEAPACDAGNDPAKGTMLGATQEKWLLDGLRGSKARWNVIATSVMMARLDHDGPTGDIIWHDAWDGFPASRRAITDTFTAAKVRNPVLVAGDWHSTFVNDVKSDFDNPDSPVVATEFVGTSISTNGDGEVYGPYYGPMIQWNPHIKFFDGDRRGYVTCRLSADEWRTDLRMVLTVSRADAAATTFASFVIEDRKPGAVRI